MMNSQGMEIPDEILEKWQVLLDELAEKADIPCATITRADFPEIENFLTSNSSGNPVKAGHKGAIAGSYCERVIDTDRELLVPDALTDPEWDTNPDVKYGLIAYLGLPLHYADGKPFGTICILDSRENKFGEDNRDLLIKYQKEVEADLAAIGKK
jgi:GAF domain-containing protein